MVTVAERVEDAADAAWLREIGIDCLQGWLYGRPSARPELPGVETPAAGRATG
jgi:EAL domain-containing protein (putative c-di-GMP-specific phosphodiesterase class I)